MSDICIVGNGIIGLQTAYELHRRDPNLVVTVIGPAQREGSASLAAAAMLNSFCEVESGTLHNKVELEKFRFNKLSTQLWPNLLEQLIAQSGQKIHHGFGTFLINNTATDALEDENYEAVAAALALDNEPFDSVRPQDIPGYKPEARCRATRALHIPREGWVNPIELMQALEGLLRRRGVRFIDDHCERLTVAGNRIIEAKTGASGTISAEQFLLSPGASFTAIAKASGLGERFQRIFYGAGATVLLQTDEATATSCVRTPNRGLACGLYSAPQNSAQTLVGASNFISPVAVAHPRLTSTYTILKSAMEQLNTDFQRCGLVRVNFGWRPTSSDTLPMLGACSIDNLFVATGTKRDGLHCSPAIAEFLADLMLDAHSPQDFSLFAPERKPLKYLSRQEGIDALVRNSINAAYQHDFMPAKSRMKEELENYYREQFTRLHDEVGASDWGIPAELKDMYRYGHIC